VSALALATDVDAGSILLNLVGKSFGGASLEVRGRVTDGQLDRTIEGSSTLTITLEDDQRLLLRSGLFDQQIDLQFDGTWWRSMQVAKQADTLTITFEDRIISLLRLITHPRKVSRSQMTRAEFAMSIVREVKGYGEIPFVCPELHTVQPIAKASQKPTKKQKQASKSPGLPLGQTFYVRDANGNRSVASMEQKQNAQTALDVAQSVGAGDRATLALLEACMIESNLKNLDYGDRDSLGILQVRTSTAQGMGIDNRDVAACCNAFLTKGFWGKGSAITLAAKNPSQGTGWVAQNTQGSAYPDRYQKAEPEARAFLAAYTGNVDVAKAVGGAAAAGAQTTTEPYQFQRGGTAGALEDSWTCLQRLASEVQWVCFVDQGAVWFTAETTLIGQAPVATLSELALGVDAIDFTVDNNQADSQATVTLRAWQLAFPPGSCVMVEDCGPADDRWLVRDVQRGLFDAAATLSLKRATKPLPEPAATTTTIAGTAAKAAPGLTGLGINTQLHPTAGFTPRHWEGT